eukprot:9907854-Ditylum_brightwellii.AAC.1
MSENSKLHVDELYLQYAEVLLMTDLEPVEFPTLIYFVTGYSKFLHKIKILALIEKLKKHYNLSWLQ